MYSGDKYLVQTIINYRGNYNHLSGGLPHSEIFGSKPIPGSPKLIAGYHVLHRLLLPRHPPNALFALDLIQKEQDRSPPSGIKSSTFPHHAWFVRDAWLVYLTWNNIAFPVEPETFPHSGMPAILHSLLSKRCQSSEGSDEQTLQPVLADMIRRRMVGRGGLEPPTSRLSGVRSNHLSYRPIRAELKGRPTWWSVSGSNR